MAILITDAAVSLAAQLSDATHTLGGGFAFALPALAFLALTKLVLSRANPQEDQTHVRNLHRNRMPLARRPLSLPLPRRPQRHLPRLRMAQHRA